MAESDPIDTRDVVQGSKIDVKDSAMETFILPTEESSSQGDSQQKALPEPLIEDALPWADGEERETEDSDRLEDVFQDEIVNAFVKMVDFKKFARSRRGLCLDEIDIENIISVNQHSIHEQKIQILNKWREKKGRAATAFNIRSLIKKFNNPDSKKVPRYQAHSQQQTLPEPLIQDALPWAGGEERETDGSQQRAQLFSVQLSHSQDQHERFLAKKDVQTQTEIKSYQENGFKTDKVKTLDANSQTNEQSLPAVAPSSTESALEMIELYKYENPKQDVGDFLPILEITWKFIQAKILLKSIKKHLVPESEIQLTYTTEQNLSTLISRVDDVFETGIRFASEYNFIHALVSLYAAANFYKINNENSVHGIRNCVLQVALFVEKMALQPGLKNIIINHVIPLMHEMKDSIQSIQGWSRDVVIHNVAMCLFNISNCYFYYKEYQQYGNMNECSIELMKKQFKDKAAKYNIYGVCLNCVGVAYFYHGKIEKSIEKYKMALKAYEEAEDWESDEDKTNKLALAENNLKRAKAKLRK